MIFISYTWADAPIAHRLHDRLEHLGRETWIDFRRLDLGGCIESQLNNAIQSATLILMLDSPSARHSKWIRFELACAERACTPVMFVPALSGGALWEHVVHLSSHLSVGAKLTRSPKTFPLPSERFSDSIFASERKCCCTLPVR